MEQRPNWAPDEVDITRPSVARVYDYYLGGSHNFAADRAFADNVLSVLPDMPRVARHNRAFMRRAVRYLCRSGVNQFIDLGSGIPSAGNVHEVAAEHDPASRTVYVDHDPVAVAHSRSLLTGEARAGVLLHDLRDAGAVLADPALRDLLDMERPVAILLVSVLHFVPDTDRPEQIIEEYISAVPRGSHIVLSHASADGQQGAAAAQELYNRGASPSPMRMRSRSETAALLGTLEIIPPGVVRIPQWRPDDEGNIPADVETYPGFAAVARS